ncbi:MAG TPA: VOC family protein [Propionibacteriaceae bacterium]|nr:VOC family protein [Propionibacteriaceae bacterium]
MTTRTSPWPTGAPCWTDLATPDVEAARKFFGEVLGWTFQAAGEGYGGYVIAERVGGTTAGIGPLQPGQQRPSWTLYFASDDADRTAGDVTAHGGSLLLPPGDVGDMGRMFIASDPTGAVFGIWQAGAAIGASLVNEPGGITWEDLRSTDPDAAREFYGALFNFDFQALTAAGTDYTTFHLQGDPAPLGGMGGMFGAADGTPSHWLVYFSVSDADEATAAVASHGGQVIAGPFDTPFGRMAGVADPAGAIFWIAQTAPSQAMPDRSG